MTYVIVNVPRPPLLGIEPDDPRGWRPLIVGELASAVAELRRQLNVDRLHAGWDALQLRWYGTAEEWAEAGPLLPSVDYEGVPVDREILSMINRSVISGSTQKRRVTLYLSERTYNKLLAIGAGNASLGCYRAANVFYPEPGQTKQGAPDDGTPLDLSSVL